MRTKAGPISAMQNSTSATRPPPHPRTRAIPRLAPAFRSSLFEEPASCDAAVLGKTGLSTRTAARSSPPASRCPPGRPRLVGRTTGTNCSVQDRVELIVHHAQCRADRHVHIEVLIGAQPATEEHPSLCLG